MCPGQLSVSASENATTKTRKHEDQVGSSSRLRDFVVAFDCQWRRCPFAAPAWVGVQGRGAPCGAARTAGGLALAGRWGRVYSSSPVLDFARARAGSIGSFPAEK